MTRDYLSIITPDSLTGTIFAMEGIKRTVTLLNGPTGCKYYHSSTSDNQVIRQREFDPLRYPATWYFGQPRVPCTYLDSKDYVYGSQVKLEEALEFLRDNIAFDLLCIINSPGAALIGDNLEGIARSVLGDMPYITIETPGFSEDVCLGYETAALALIDKMATTKYDVEPKTVNILGLSIYHRNFNGDSAELERLLNLCGIAVNCVLCADCEAERIASLSKAALNIVLHPEYATATVEALYDRFGTPYYVCDGAPIGFKATEQFVTDTCGALSCDPTPALEESAMARARAYPLISRVHSLSGLPKGVPFAVEGTYSELYAYTKCLVEYFGMVLDCASVLNPEQTAFKARYLELLRAYGFEHALEREILDTSAEMLFASGITIAKLKLRKREFIGIETALPSMGYIDVIPKTNLGVNGALQLTEQVLNALSY